MKRTNPLTSILKEIGFSIVQLWYFSIELSRGSATFHPEVVEGDWPHSKRRAKFLVLGTIQVKDEDVYTQLWETTYKLSSSPQKEFFRKLDSGLDIETDPYYLSARERLDEDTFDQWLRDRLSLWENYRKDPWEAQAIAVRVSKTGYMVEDGAHRLSLRSLDGFSSHVLRLRLWSFKNLGQRTSSTRPNNADKLF